MIRDVHLGSGSRVKKAPDPGSAPMFVNSPSATCELPHLEDLHELGDNVGEGDEVVGHRLPGQLGGGGRLLASSRGEVGTALETQLAHTRDIPPIHGAVSCGYF